ncbi:MAG: type II CRISPR-associated endonuclease Cas1 [Bacteroidota bacterium]|jgi:CRISPR-associated protein Cas1|nr:type II CRISPR-associated endonuclease Cas1 [Cytophagales bacterium]MCE2957465.1 type II CRISPR-associated endonuclease Cas1 [Flammeovirgaceae bacterium]MCZ8071617.1 type II CRISPR-associated endonuclease Cas1 [Cytophagales bacterium]
MIKRTLYFGNPAYLSTRLNQLVVRLPEIERNDSLPDGFKKDAQATIPIEDIGVVILDHQQIVVSQALIAKLLENNAAVITCNHTHHPTGLLLNLDGHSLQSQRFQAQIEASEPLKKQLWQQTIKAKIKNQAFALSVAGHPIQNMLHWADAVKSGDAENHEGRAAAWYWKNVLNDVLPPGQAFVRDAAGDPPNNLLNYGYAIIRATAARALVGSGLLPTLGIFHRNQYNAYCLADDIMEPYRPYADMLVRNILKENEGIADELSTETKRKLLTLPALDVKMEGETSPLMIALQRTSASLAKCFLGETRKIAYPLME